MSRTLIEPYLFFGGRCEEALSFYQQAVGAELDMLMRFNESPDPPPPDTVPDGYEDKVMHSSFRIGESRIMASDGCGEGTGFQGFTLSIAVDTAADALVLRHEAESPTSHAFDRRSR